LNDLRKYLSESVKAMAANMRSELAAGILNQEQLSDTLADFILRDEQGAYWALAPRSQQWYRHSPEGWTAAVSAPASFEGPASLGVWAPRIEPEDATARTELDGKTASNALEFIQNLVKDVNRSYERGLLTSLTANALVADVFLMDVQNRFWTVGFHTTAWYYFELEQWHKADEPPANDALMDTKSPANQEQFDQQVINFLVAMAGTPPEAIAEDWEPPVHFPEPVVKCTSCSRVDVGNHTHCKFCNSELPETSMVVEKTTKFCIQCGHEQSRQMKFCVQCGAKF
jgi:hypothetical protein